MPLLQTADALLLDAALARLRAGEPLTASFMYDHGLEWPLHTDFKLTFERGAFVYSTQTDELGPTIVFGTPTAETLYEEDLRAQAETRGGLRFVLGLQPTP